MAQHSLPTCVVLQEDAAAACIQPENVAEEEQEAPEMDQLEQCCFHSNQTLSMLPGSGGCSVCAHKCALLYLHLAIITVYQPKPQNK